MVQAEFSLKNMSQDSINPVYLIAGGEDFLVEQTLRKILSHSVVPGTEDFNLDILYGNETEAASIVNIAMSYPMMAERRTVIVKNLEQLPGKGFNLLVQYVSKPSPTTCLILTAHKLDFRKAQFASIKKDSIYIEAKPLYDNQVPVWVKSYLAEQDIKITDNAIRLLQASTGNSLRRIATELEKIRLNLLSKKTIEPEDVEKVVGVSRQYNVFEFCDAVGSKNIKKSISILNGMLQLGESPNGLLSMLNRHYMILTKLKELQAEKTRREQIAKQLRINPFFINNYAQQARQYSREQFTTIFDLLLEADLQLKTSYQKPKMVMELLLINICNC